jgi:carboxymethylenebutenolidase
MRTTYAYENGEGDGYLALPENGQGAGILVCHAWWGLNAFFQGVCDRLAGEGFAAFAPDVFAGQVATSIDAAKALRQSVDRDVVNAQLKGAVAFLRGHDAVIGDRVGVLGCSLGAHYGFWVSNNCPNDIAAVVAFYGTGGGNLAKAQAAYLGHYAETDTWGAGPKSVDKLRQKLEANGLQVTFHTYPGTSHWFFESDVPDAYDPEAAELAWNRSVGFLRDQLS